MARNIREIPLEEKNYIYDVSSQAETDIEEKTLGELLRQLDRGRIIDNIPIQRDANQWSLLEKSFLVHTILINLSIMPISLAQNGTGAGAIRLLIDGKQRLSICRQFKNNEFTLSSKTPTIKMRRIVKEQTLDEDGQPMFEKQGRKTVPVMVDCYDDEGNVLTEEIEYKIAGKYFSELPDELQEQFEHYGGMKQLVHKNYSEAETQLQMLRDNISAKMTPAQTGMVICGNELADWLRSFRTSNLFMNCSSWSDTEEKKSLKERCVIEAFILGYLEDRWYKNNTQNIELFKAHAVNSVLNQYKERIEAFGELLLAFPQLKKHLTNKNMNVIIAAYIHFCDMDVVYSDSDFGDFLVKWFDEIKDTTDYEVEGNTGTKRKITILGKLAIIDEKCQEYMHEYGTVVEVKNNDTMDLDVDAESLLADFFEEFGDDEDVALASLAEIDNRTALKGDFTKETLSKYKEFFLENPDSSLVDRVLTAENDIFNVNLSEDNLIINKYNLPILIHLYDNSVDSSEVDREDFMNWLKAFDDCTEVVETEIAGMTFDDLCNADDQTSNGTIRNKYAVLDRSLCDYITSLSY